MVRLVWENDKVNTLELAKVNKPKISHKVVVQLTVTHNLAQKQTITYEEEKFPWYFLWLVSLRYGMLFDKKDKTRQGAQLAVCCLGR